MINIKKIKENSNQTTFLNHNSSSLIELDMYVRGIVDYSKEKSPGKYAVILSCKNKEKVITGVDIEGTSNKMILKAILEGVKKLNKPSLIKVHTHSLPNINKINSSKKKDSTFNILNDLNNAIKNGNHSLELVCDKFRQKELISILKNTK